MTKQLLKTLLLAVLMLWGTASYAQVLMATDFNEQVPAGTCDSVLQQSWNTGSSMWVTDSIQKINLNSNNYLSEILAYDPSTGTLAGGMYFTRNANERATKLEVKFGTFVIGNYTATYDINGLLTEQIGKQLNQLFQLENFERLVLTYDGNDNLTEVMQYAWDGTQWVDNYRYTYSYNTSNERTGYVAELYNGTAYENETQVTYTYTSTGKVETELIETWNGSAWESSSRLTTSYNTSDEEERTLTETWTGSAWANAVLDSMFSDGTNITYTWSGSAWAPAERNACGTPSMPTNPPSDPNTLFATASGSTEVNMSWDHSPSDISEDGFIIQRSGDATNWVTIDSTGPDEITYKDINVSAGNDYYYRVAAYNQHGLSGWSNVSTVTTPLTPVAPSNLSANTVSASEIELTWNENANDELGTIIERSFNGTTGWTLVDTIAADATSYNDTGLAPATTHFYRVYVYNAGGVSPYSNVANATTMSTIPGAPANLQATIIGGKVQLSWNDVSGNETGFYVYRSDDNTNFTKIDSTDEDVTTYLDSIVTAGNSYYYYVTAYNGMGESESSDTVQADLPVGIAEAATGLISSVYPNPAVNSVVVQFTNEVSSQVRIRIFDLTGRAMITENVSLQGNMHTVDVSSLASGNYVIEVSTENLNYTGKIIKK